MSPAIPLGSVVDLTTVKATDLKVGDVVTIQSPGGTVYTHRINRIVNLPDGTYVETEGDAVGEPDAPIQPVREIQGRVSASVPFLGYLIYMLSVPTGVMSLIFLALTMLMCIWLLEDIEDEWSGDDNYRDRGRPVRKSPSQPKVRERRIGQWAG
jgi:signal peptidase